jgi:hypothetical protein
VSTGFRVSAETQAVPDLKAMRVSAVVQGRVGSGADVLRVAQLLLVLDYTEQLQALLRRADRVIDWGDAPKLKDAIYRLVPR